MGAGQIGGIATMLEIDFKNAAGFLGTKTEVVEAQHVVHFFSHALIFCMGALIEPHVVLTPAICVYGERYKFDVIAGTHKFLENAGIYRQVKHVCIHKAYNHTTRWMECNSANLALLVLSSQFSFSHREPPADYVVNRVRYGVKMEKTNQRNDYMHCRFYGWGSRRNGYLVPLLIHLRRLDVNILPKERCTQIWNYDSQFLCVEQQPCKSEKFGALCPDDIGSVMECSGFLVGMMTSRLIDRPCGVGYLDLNKFQKFLTCGVDAAREITDHDSYLSFDYSSYVTANTPEVITVPPEDQRQKK